MSRIGRMPIPLPANVKFCGNCGSAVELPPEPPDDTQAEPAAKEPAEV